MLMKLLADAAGQGPNGWEIGSYVCTTVMCAVALGNQLWKRQKSDNSQLLQSLAESTRALSESARVSHEIATVRHEEVMRALQKR